MAGDREGYDGQMTDGRTDRFSFANIVLDGCLGCLSAYVFIEIYCINTGVCTHDKKNICKTTRYHPQSSIHK